MYRILFLFNILFIIFPVFSQTPQANLQKYWNMRNRLTNYFVAVSPTDEPGSNIPAIGLQTDNSAYWSDGNATLQFYIGMLATEYKLLQLYGQDVTETKNQLLYALKAVERLDRTAETYWPGGSSNLNGFFIRDDVSNSIKSLNSNFNSYIIGSTFTGDYTFSTYTGGVNPTTGHPKECSQDNIWNYLPNLALVRQLVDDPTINQKAKDISYRMVNYMHSNGSMQIWEPCGLLSGCFPGHYVTVNDDYCWRIKNPVTGEDDFEGSHVDEAGFCSTSDDGMSYGFAEAAGWITGQNLHYGNSPTKSTFFKTIFTNNFGFDSYQYRTLTATAGPPEPNVYDVLITQMDNGYIYEHLPLIYTILHGKVPSFYNNWTFLFDAYQQLLNLCPECGPYDFGPDGIAVRGLPYRPNAWSADNRLLWPNNLNNNGSNGYFNGLDYMLLHNLVWLAYIADQDFGCSQLSGTMSINSPDPNVKFDCSILNGWNIDLHVGNSITFSPGFSAANGSVFSANTTGSIASTYPKYQKLTPIDCYVNQIALRSSNENRVVSSQYLLKDTLSKANTYNIILPNTISIYPNPTNGLLTIDIANIDNNTAVTIYNYSGQKLYNSIITAAKTVIDLSPYTAGVYMVKITTNDMSKMVKVIRN